MKLKYFTVSDLLLDILKKLMANEIFNDFVLVGGTALSLQLGHRISIDIDLFTEKPYGSMAVEQIKNTLSKLFPYTKSLETLDDAGLVYSVYVGNNEKEYIKLDLCYTDNFITPVIQQDGLRLASVIDIAAMKMLAIVTGNRKKDFWDIHELLDYYSLDELIQWSLERNPYTLDRESIIKAFDKMDSLDDSAPVQCLKGKYWEFVKEDIREVMAHIKK
jgi:predicted nucleotidyltransferase component of viral defense system